MSPGYGGHSALIYSGLDEFVAEVSGYVREGLDGDERVRVLASAEKLASLRSELGPDGGSIEFADSGPVFRPQHRSTLATLRFLREAGDRRSRVVTEQALHRRSPFEIEDYHRIEAAANVIYRPYPVSVLCPYDAGVLSDEIVTGCQQTHTDLRSRAPFTRRSDFVDPAEFIAGRAAVVAPPRDSVSFHCETAADLVAARSFVTTEAQLAGLTPDETYQLEVAASEIITNALTHGAPPCIMYIYVEGQSLVCHVNDHGEGFADPLAGYLPPEDGTAGGRGLWLSRQFCDCVDIASDESGTHVRLFMLTGDD